MICNGGAQVSILPGYWRSFITSEKIDKCPQESLCIGGFEKICYEGHAGGFCESCDLYNYSLNGSYSHKSKYTCGTCKDVS